VKHFTLAGIFLAILLVAGSAVGCESEQPPESESEVLEAFKAARVPGSSDSMERRILDWLNTETDFGMRVEDVGFSVNWLSSSDEWLVGWVHRYNGEERTARWTFDFAAREANPENDLAVEMQRD